MLALGMIQQLETREFELWLFDVTDNVTPEKQEDLALQQYHDARQDSLRIRLVFLKPLQPSKTPQLLDTVMLDHGEVLL